jgi:hypothetical protein
MNGFIPLPGSHDFLYAANDDSNHRPPPFRDVMDARKRLAQIASEQSAALSLAWFQFCRFPISVVALRLFTLA